MKKVIYVGVWLFSVFLLANATIANLTGDPIFKPFGTSTTFKDSTNYVTLNKGFYLQDSLKVAKDLYVGVKGGVIYLDTNRSAKIEYTGNTFKITNNKSTGGMYFDNTANSTNAGFSFVMSEGTPSFSIYKYRNGQLTTALTYDTLTGLQVLKGDIQLSGGTQQIKIPSDTASDYDNNDNITLNRQSGTLTTKSLTTAAGDLYVLTLTNSLISSTSKIFASLNDGTITQGLTILYQTRPSSGTGSIVIYNAHASQAFNGTLKIYYVIFN